MTNDQSIFIRMFTSHMYHHGHFQIKKNNYCVIKTSERLEKNYICVKKSKKNISEDDQKNKCHDQFVNNEPCQ